jgi:hypothetical protein
MISLSFFDVDSSAIESQDTGTFVAIQWHISDHSGLSRDGASGSVKAMVYVSPEDREELELEVAWSLMVGASLSSSGSIVLPSLAISFGQETVSVRLGMKSLITIGMISAFISLCKSLAKLKYK